MEQPNIEMSIATRRELQLIQLKIEDLSNRMIKFTKDFSKQEFIQAESEFHSNLQEKITDIKKKLKKSLEKIEQQKSNWKAAKYENGSYIGEYKELSSSVPSSNEQELKNCTREGLGIYYFMSGTIYKGEFKDNFPNGLGMFIYNSKDVYIGQIKNGALEGYGYYIYTNGNTYSGQFAEGKKNGYGQFYTDIFKYEGNFKDDDFSGFGKRIFKDGEINEVFINNETGKGIGIVHVPGFGKYEGEFYKGEKNGVGIFTFDDGKIIQSEWKNGVPNGKGITIYSDGKKSFGDYNNNELSNEIFFD